MISVAFLFIILHLTTILLHAQANSNMSPNHLLNKRTLFNSFFALRHGQSLANVSKIISSDPIISTVEHGLSDVGKEQARSAGRQYASDYLARRNSESSSSSRGVAVFSSDFTRARETAEIFANELKQRNIPLYNNGNVVLETKLRERYFGSLNGGSDTRYQDVWDVDVNDPNHTKFDVESANSVLERTTRFICELDDTLQESSSGEDKNDGESWQCVLVAHGDVLQIMQTGFMRHGDASRHRELEHLETAAIRELKLSSLSL
eukprot:scaffold34524_cov73-Cyclotella_meneghiniana.AAC.3